MGKSTRITFTHKEVATAMLKQQGLHEGIWGIYVKFGIGAANVGASDSTVMPSAIVPVVEIGLQPFDKENNLSVGAAKINPKPRKSKRSVDTPKVKPKPRKSKRSVEAA